MTTPPSAPSSTPSSLTARLVPRARLVGTAAVAGALVGALSVLVFGPSGLAETVFALGALVMGFGLLGWAGSMLVGSAVENMKQYLDLGTDWTEADSRRAMARLGGFGAGVMVGIAVVGTIVTAIS